MKLGSFKLINSLAILPLVLLFSLIIVVITSLMSFESDQVSILKPFVLFVMVGYYAVPTIGIPYLLIWGTSIGFGWQVRDLTTKHKVLLSAFTIVVLCYSAYIIWWHFSSQKFSYL